jgi:hypothetical protein
VYFNLSNYIITAKMSSNFEVSDKSCQDEERRAKEEDRKIK